MFQTTRDQALSHGPRTDNGLEEAFVGVVYQRRKRRGGSGECFEAHQASRNLIGVSLDAADEDREVGAGFVEEDNLEASTFRALDCEAKLSECRSLVEAPCTSSGLATIPNSGHSTTQTLVWTWGACGCGGGAGQYS